MKDAFKKKASEVAKAAEKITQAVRNSAPYQKFISKPFDAVRRQWRSKFSQKMIVTSIMAGVFVSMLPLSFPFASWMMVKGGYSLMTGMGYAAGVLGTIGGVGMALASAMDLLQYGLNPDKTMRHVNARDQTVEGPRRKVIQLMNLENQASIFSYKLAWNPNNEQAKEALRDVFARADQLMDGVKILDAGKRGAGLEKYEYSAVMPPASR